MKFIKFFLLFTFFLILGNYSPSQVMASGHYTNPGSPAVAPSGCHAAQAYIAPSGCHAAQAITPPTYYGPIFVGPTKIVSNNIKTDPGLPGFMSQATSNPDYGQPGHSNTGIIQIYGTSSGPGVTWTATEQMYSNAENKWVIIETTYEVSGNWIGGQAAVAAYCDNPGQAAVAAYCDNPGQATVAPSGWVEDTPVFNEIYIFSGGKLIPADQYLPYNSKIEIKWSGENLASTCTCKYEDSTGKNKSCLGTPGINSFTPNSALKRTTIYSIACGGSPLTHKVWISPISTKVIER